MIFRQVYLTDTFQYFILIKLGFVVELDTTIAQFMYCLHMRTNDSNNASNVQPEFTKQETEQPKLEPPTTKFKIQDVSSLVESLVNRGMNLELTVKDPWSRNFNHP